MLVKMRFGMGEWEVNKTGSDELTNADCINLLENRTDHDFLFCVEPENI